MSSIPAISAPASAQGCLPSFIAYPIDLITSVVSKIFALVGQLFSRIQEGLSRLFSWSATPVQASSDPVRTAHAVPHDARSMEVHREQSRASTRRVLAEMHRRHTEKVLQLQAALTTEMQAHEKELETPERNAKLRALKTAAMEATHSRHKPNEKQSRLWSTLDRH